MAYKGSREMAALYASARAAGMVAAAACVPPAMIVMERENPLNDSSDVKRAWHVPDGPCGFAWVKLRPANSKFANWCKKNDIGRLDSYAGGYVIWVREYGQSVAKKEAFAHAFAKVLSEAGLNAYGESRLD